MWFLALPNDAKTLWYYPFKQALQAFGKVIHTHLFFFFSQHSWHLGFSWSYVCQLVVQFTELCHGKFACTVRFFKFLLLCGDFFICLLKNLKIITKSSVNTQHTMHVHSNLCYGCLLWEMSIYRGCPLVEDQLYTLLARPSHFHTKPCSFSSIKKLPFKAHCCIVLVWMEFWLIIVTCSIYKFLEIK